MYQIYKNPTKYPIGQSYIFRDERIKNDRKLKQNIKKTHALVDDKPPTHFPLRYSQTEIRLKKKKLEKENKRIADELTKLKTYNTITSINNHPIKYTKHKTRNKSFYSFKERTRKLNEKKIQKQNELLYKRLKNIKPSVFNEQKKNNEFRKNYLNMREHARMNDYFMINSNTNNKKKNNNKKNIIKSNSIVKLPNIKKKITNTRK